MASVASTAMQQHGINSMAWHQWHQWHQHQRSSSSSNSTAAAAAVDMPATHR
jgi:transposase-like protein